MLKPPETRGFLFQEAPMSLEEKEGVLDRVTEKGILLSGARLNYSKWFEGERPREDQLGCKMRVVIDVGDKCSFVKKVLHVDGKAAGWKPPESPEKGSFGGGGRRLSPEELELKKEEGIRIARSVAIDRAITIVERGLPIEKIAPVAAMVEQYLLKGILPSGIPIPTTEITEKPPTPIHASSTSSRTHENSPKGALANEATPSKVSKPKKLEARVVNTLFNQALRGGLVGDWYDFIARIEEVLKVKVKSPYHLELSSWALVDTFVRSKLGQSAAA